MKMKIMELLQVQLNSKMLKDVGAKYVIIGHSENRQAEESLIRK